jgi:hypothetical protein
LNRLLWAIAGLLLCQGCASNPSTQAAAIKEVTARQVMNCTLISTITGKSLMGGMGATGATNALVDAKEQASGLGATHVVVQSVEEGSMSTPGIARVKAYKCN